MPMGMSPLTAIYLPWIIWALTWTVAALWANRTVGRPSAGSGIIYRIMSLAGFVLLLGAEFKVHDGQVSVQPLPGPLAMRYWQAPLAVEWAMVGVAALGFLFAWWARLHLGRLWSGRITRKEGHRIVDTGPYAIVRHPIYTGILTAAIASTVVMGNLHAILGTVLLIVAYWIKARLEERWLRDELGAADYDAYRRRVPMLVPFGPKPA
jgi:protein-S-isoprenylcysteine O-methyltransferase Ste14